MDLKRWKSIDTVDFTPKFLGEEESYFADHRSHSESSLEPCVVVYSEASSPAAAAYSGASSPCAPGDGSDASLAEDKDSLEGKLHNVERKIDELHGLLQEQLVVVCGLRRELASLASVTSRRPPAAETDYLQSLELLARLVKVGRAGGGVEEVDARARCLLDAIELKHLQRIDFQIKDSICKFLQSDDLKTHLSSATAESLQPVVRSCLSEAFSRALQPALDAAYRRLLKLVTGLLHTAFQRLEVNTAGMLQKSSRATRGLRAAIHKHQALLDAQSKDHHLHDVLEEVLQNELKQWRSKLFEVIMSEVPSAAGGEDEDTDLTSPVLADSAPSAQPTPPASSAVNKLMKSAVIKKHIEEGHINASFEEALSSGDLALVVAACRGAEPARVFGPPCRLRQPVLLSLVQQLVTDMVHDTHLKCRYLEEAITKLDAWEPVTRAHLPLVVREVRTHLTRFLQAYPGHVAATRINLIIMAANNLIK